MNHFQNARKIKEVYQYALPKPGQQWPQSIRRVYTFINTHLFELQLTVGWVKEECRINRKSFAGHFQNYIYRSPKEYIMHHRIEVAKLLLKQTETTVTAIAISIGFNSLSAFDNSFKTREDLTPSKWREQN